MALTTRFLRPFQLLFNPSFVRATSPQCQVAIFRWYNKYTTKPLAPPPKPKPLDVESLPCYGVFTPSVCKFIAKRDYENHNSGILAWVTSFTGEDTLRLIDLNEFVFGANLRVDILHRVVVWQWAKRRAAP